MSKQFLIFVVLVLGAAFFLTDSRPVAAQSGAITVSVPADVTCDGSAHAFSATSLSARWVQIIPAATGNAAAIRVGDSNVSSSRGWPIAGGGAMAIPPMPVDARESTQQHFLNLANLYYSCTTGDKFSWGYVR